MALLKEIKRLKTSISILEAEISQVEDDLFKVMDKLAAVEDEITQLKDKIAKGQSDPELVKKLQGEQKAFEDKKAELRGNENELQHRENELRGQMNLLHVILTEKEDELEPVHIPLANFDPEIRYVYNYCQILLDTLKHARIDGDVLKLNPDHMGCFEGSSHKGFYIRKCYSYLYEEIVDKYINQVLEPNSRCEETTLEPIMRKNFNVTGTSGVGLTTFGFYLMHRLMETGKSFYFEPFSNCQRNVIFLYTNDQLIIPSEIATSEQPPSANIYIVDSKAPSSIVSSYNSICTILINPSRTEFSELYIQKLGCGLFKRVLTYAIPRWTVEELETCRKLCIGSTRDFQIKEKFEYCGGIPRLIFAYGIDELKAFINEAILSTNLIELALILRKFGAKTSSVLAQVDNKPGDETYTTVTRLFPSEYVYLKVLSVYQRAITDEIFRFSASPVEYSSLADSYLQRVCLELLPGSGMRFSTRRLSNMNEPECQEGTYQITQELKVSELESLDGIANTESGHFYKLVAGFPNVDAFSITSSKGEDLLVNHIDLYRFKYLKMDDMAKVDERYLLLLTQLKERFSRDGNCVFKLYYVLPGEVYRKYTFKNFQRELKEQGDDQRKAEIRAWNKTRADILGFHDRENIVPFGLELPRNMVENSLEEMISTIVQSDALEE